MNLLELPDEILHLILSFLPWPSLLSLSAVSSILRSLSSDNNLWHSLFISRWSEEDTTSPNDGRKGDWKERYRQKRSHCWKTLLSSKPSSPSSLIDFLFDDCIAAKNDFVGIASYILQIPSPASSPSFITTYSSCSSLKTERAGRSYAPLYPLYPSTLSEILAQTPPLLEAFMSFLAPSFIGNDLEKSLGYLLSLVRPPSSTILRAILLSFSRAYCTVNHLPLPGKGPLHPIQPKDLSSSSSPDFSSSSASDSSCSSCASSTYPSSSLGHNYDSDVIYMLCHCCLLLNTDLHSGKIRKKMSSKRFLEACRRVGGLNQVSDLYLKELYQRIEKKSVTNF